MELFPWDHLSEGDLRDSDLAESVGGLGQLGHPHDDRAGLGRGELDGGGALGEGPLAAFISSGEIIRHGRVLQISCAIVGSRLTRYTSY